ncbi:ATP-binding protein [Sporosarcina trichiuri]|uniref:ATP-binding protein n=1 Tax=Sporosarcina trichiuri TaxID=3056445 RepID=UPI0025B5C7EC|nr:ATP-binding protein [Sporosarcina sp. 0.2-SM1T-5]WJY27062.1 ATP-binding protein [Sporosarcina sp. 0.2-SM1T-5]
MRKRTIRTTYINIILALCGAMLILLGAAYLYSTSVFKKNSEAMEQQSEKAEVIGELSDSISNVFFRARGFYAFKMDSELDLAHEELTHIRKVNERLLALPLSAKEQQFAQEITVFIDHYENAVLPAAVNLVEEDDYEGLRELSSSGANLSVNQFIKYADRYGQQAGQMRDEFYRQSEKQVNQLYLAMALLGVCGLLFLILLSWRVVRQLIAPIESMTAAAERYVDAQDVNYTPETRPDELGSLSRSFAGMMATIQTKEQELVAQNEELLSQQDELLSQQDELFSHQRQLEDALSEARYANIRVERYSGLSHEISFSDNVREIAEATLQYLDTLFGVDKGIIHVPSNDVHVLRGISEERYKAYDDAHTGSLARLKQEPCFQTERSLADGTKVFDLFAAPVVSGDDYKALFVLSRSRRPFTEEDQEDLFNLAKRVALAVDRVDQRTTISRERQLNQTILDNLAEGIQFVSADEADVQVNDGLAYLLNVPASDLSGAGWSAELAQRSEDPAALLVFIRQALTGETGGLAETVYTLTGETPVVVALYSSPVHHDGRRIGTLFVHRDITQAFEVDKMKTELVSTVSHELRTPLSSILGFTELLIGKEMDTARQARYLQAIYKEAKRLTSLINDFLDVQRMESGSQEYSMQDVNVASIADQTIQNFSVPASHTIRLERLTDQVCCIGDEDRLIQVFTNLLSNAVKFSPDGGTVTITLAAAGSDLQVTVRDEGIGIPADQLKHMFEKFYRFDNSYSRKIGGTGLGLAICRKIIEKHGGEISVESEENAGTSVRFTLPLQGRAAEQSAERSGQPEIVVVEDDASIALLLEEELSQHQYEVIRFSDVAHSFAYAKEHTPACMVIDLMLQEQETGWDLIGRLKEDPVTCHIPIIISSALEQEEELTRKFNIRHYMTKPYPLRTLSETVAEAIRKEDGRILYPLRE